MLDIALKNSETKTIEQVYSDFLKNPAKYVNNQELYDCRRGVHHYWITDPFYKEGYSFEVKLSPEIFDCTQEEFITFFGKTLQLINQVSKTEIPFRYVEILDSTNFKQGDGKDDKRKYYSVPTIMKGNNLKDAFVEIKRRTEFLDNNTLYVYNLEGAQVSDFLLDNWFNINDNGYSIITK